MSNESVIFRTKNVSKSATGKGRTSIATKAMIPKGKKEFTKFGAKPLNLNVKILNFNLLFIFTFLFKINYLQIAKSVNAQSMPEQNSTVGIEP